MQELTKDVVDTLEKMGYADQTRQIVSSLKEFGITPDFEAIYSVLEGLGNIKQGVKDAGPFTAYVCRRLSEIENIPDSEEILKELRALIYEECSKVDKNKLNDAFDPLFQPDLDPPMKDNWLSVASRVITTNYDMAVEMYHWGNELPLTDCFHSTSNPFLKVFSPRNIPIVSDPEFGRKRRGKLLLKLHGAIWYFRQDSRIVQAINDPKNIPIDIQIAEQIMIYPTKEKPILRKPYYDFFKAFKEQIWNILIVIGYSFRDEPVNSVLLEQLESATNPHVFIVNPHASAVFKNFPNYERYSAHFHNLTIEFGKQGYEEGFFQGITQFLNENSL